MLNNNKVKEFTNSLNIVNTIGEYIAGDVFKPAVLKRI